MAYSSETHQERVQRHFSSADPDWDDFRRGLRSRKFQKLVSQHKQADGKLKRYVQNFGGYLTSKDTVGHVRSETSARSYPIRKLKNGRLSCGCKDWQFKHSHRGSDCKHIQKFLGRRGGKLKQAAKNVLPAVSQAGQAYFKNLRRFEHGRIHGEQERELEEASRQKSRKN